MKSRKEVKKKRLTIREVYQILVVEAGLSPEYVLDKMQMYEIPAILERISFRYRDSWEQTRMIMYVIAQGNSKKRLTPSDLLSFPWDKETDVQVAAPSEGEMEKLRMKMQQFIKDKESCQQI